MTTVSWDRRKFELLKSAYDKASAAGQDQFEITLKPEGKVTLVVGYAKYLIEYLTGEFARHPDQRAQPYNEGEEQPRRDF